MLLFVLKSGLGKSMRCHYFNRACSHNAICKQTASSSNRYAVQIFIWWISLIDKSSHCHSMSAKAAGKCFQRRRTFAENLGVEGDLTNNKFFLFIYILNIFHVNDTYCLGIFPVYWPRLGRNRYGTKTDVHRIPRVLFFVKGAVFVINSCIYQNKSNFPTYSAVIESEIGNVIEFA